MNKLEIAIALSHKNLLNQIIEREQKKAAIDILEEKALDMCKTQAAKACIALSASHGHDVPMTDEMIDFLAKSFEVKVNGKYLWNVLSPTELIDDPELNKSIADLKAMKLSPSNITITVTGIKESVPVMFECIADKKSIASYPPKYTLKIYDHNGGSIFWVNHEDYEYFNDIVEALAFAKMIYLEEMAAKGNSSEGEKDITW